MPYLVAMVTRFPLAYSTIPTIIHTFINSILFTIRFLFIWYCAVPLKFHCQLKKQKNCRTTSILYKLYCTTPAVFSWCMKQHQIISHTDSTLESEMTFLSHGFTFALHYKEFVLVLVLHWLSNILHSWIFEECL